MSIRSGLFGGMANTMSTLSQAIHGDVVTLGNQMDQLCLRTERLQSHADRE